MLALLLYILSCPAQAEPFAYLGSYNGVVGTFDAATNAVVGSVLLQPMSNGGQSTVYQVAVAPDGKHVYVTCTPQTDALYNVLVIDAVTNTIVRSIRVGNHSEPAGIAVAP